MAQSKIKTVVTEGSEPRLNKPKGLSDRICKLFTVFKHYLKSISPQY